MHIISLSIFSIIALITNSHLLDTDTRDVVSIPHPVIIASKNKNWIEKYGYLSWDDKIKLANEHYYTGHVLYDRSFRIK